MPDTPKSFEEWWKLFPEIEKFKHSNRIKGVAKTAWNAALASLPTKTAVGEGELPPLDDRGESVRAAFNGNSEDEANALFQLYVRERQLREAIAQRDEARAAAETFRQSNYALEREICDIREALVIVRMQDYADLSARDAAHKLYSLWQDAVHKPHGAHPENRRIAELEAKFAASAGFKEEELEKLEDMSRSGSFYAIAAYKRTIANLISRLRSQESGQAGKAGENGDSPCTAACSLCGGSGKFEGHRCPKIIRLGQ